MKKEYRVGLFALVAGAMLYFGVNFLKGTDFVSSNLRYYVIYDRVDGLTVSAPVQVNGLTVGRVQKITLDPRPPYRALVTLQVDRSLPLPRGTAAMIASPDLLGGKVISLSIPEGPAGSYLVKNDTLPGALELSMTDNLTRQAAPALANLDTISQEVKVLLRGFGGTRQALDGTLEGFTQTSQALNRTLAQAGPNVTELTGRLSNLAGDLTRTQRTLSTMVDKYSALGDTLNRANIGRTIQDLDQSIVGLNRVVTDVRSGKGTLGKLSQNDSLYQNLNRSSESLDALLKDMRDRPGRYVHFSVFGRRPGK